IMARFYKYLLDNDITGNIASACAAATFSAALYETQNGTTPEEPQPPVPTGTIEEFATQYVTILDTWGKTTGTVKVNDNITYNDVNYLPAGTTITAGGKTYTKAQMLDVACQAFTQLYKGSATMNSQLPAALGYTYSSAPWYEAENFGSDEIPLATINTLVTVMSSWASSHDKVFPNYCSFPKTDYDNFSKGAYGQFALERLNLTLARFFKYLLDKKITSGIATACKNVNFDCRLYGTPVVPDSSLRLGTFNIRLDTTSDTNEKDWTTARKANCAAIIKKYAPDVFGLQEVLAKQQTDLKSLLSAYTFKFVGRDDGTNGEAIGIAYNAKKVSVVKSGHFWLSDTPDKASNSECWGGLTRKRVAVWMRLKDKTSGKEFYFLSTHLEVNTNGVSMATVRTKSAELIISRLKSYNSANLPQFICGDMNCSSDSEEFLTKFRAVYSDAFQVAEAGGFRQGCKATYNAFDLNKNMERNNGRLDIFFYNAPVTLTGYRAADDKYNGYWPSDHVPVFIDVKF
ncbi:MAG: endonuclease/exonuclease/phosphatase family protein, partial [Bacteroidales bacterium]|nr:endonuclease/exonuclease/phosphatase family protein [Bacteroidales bacterium]